MLYLGGIVRGINDTIMTVGPRLAGFNDVIIEPGNLVLYETDVIQKSINTKPSSMLRGRFSDSGCVCLCFVILVSPECRGRYDHQLPGKHDLYRPAGMG